MSQGGKTPGNILADLTQASLSTRAGGRDKGRFVRTPKYEAPAARSTRPRSDRGVTFHFAHKAISKRNDISQSQENATSSSAHQTYIERKEAGAELSGEEQRILGDIEIYDTQNEDLFDEEVTSSEQYKLSKNSGYQHPTLTIAADRMGFGTVGKTTAERRRFWQRVETSERRHGRVQSRIIAELPHEISNAERAQIAGSFCQELHKKGLPFWAAIHAPTKKNDGRNYHLHVAYYDRPSLVDSEGNWDFEHQEKVRLKNRSTKTIRPLLQRKPASIRDRSWVKNLRKAYATESNKVLEGGEYEKRLDERSYKESGVLKEPTKHLGFKANAMEKFGLETEVGQENARKEMKWKISERTRRWDNAIAQEEVVGFFLDDDLSGSFFEDSGDKITKLREGRNHALKSVQATLLSEQLTLRLEKRKAFVGEESKRLLMRGRGFLIGETVQDIMVLDAEQEIIETRESDIYTMSKNLATLSVKEAQAEEIIWTTLYEKPSKENEDTSDIFGSGSFDDDVFESWTTENNIAASLFSEPQNPAEETLFEQDIEDSLDDLLVIDESEEANTETPQERQGSLVRKTEEQSTSSSTEKAANIDSWALLVEPPKSSEEIKDLDEKLKGMTNKTVRMMAVGTRDLVDFYEDGEARDSANRGWIVLKHEAARRGLDLETGRQNLGKASDKQRAELHRDEYLRSVLEVRQEVIKTQTR